MNDINISEQVTLLKENENNPKAFFKQLEAIFRNEILLSIFEGYTKDRKIDIFKMAFEAMEEGVDTFTISFILEKLTKYSIYEIDSLKLLYPQMYDVSSGNQYTISAEIVRNNKNFGKKFLLFLLQNGENWSFGHASTIYAILFKDEKTEIFDELIELLNSDKINYQIIAVQTISRIDCENFNEKQLEIVSNNLERLMKQSNLDLDIEIINALKKCFPKFKNIVVSYSKYDDENIKYNLSNLLVMLDKSYSHERWFRDVLFSLVNTDSKFQGIIQNLQMILHNLLEDNANRDIVIDFIFSWLEHSDISEDKKVLKEFVDYILPSFDTNRLVTSGLNHDNFKINKVMQLFITNDTLLDINIMKKFEDEDYIYLLRRIMGYIVGFDKQIRLVFSLYRSDSLNDNIIKNIEYVISNYIYKNYPIDTIDFLKNTSQDTEFNALQKKVAKNLSKHLQNIEKQYSSISKLMELKPSMHDRRLVQNANYDLMSKAIKEAEEESIWRILGTTVHLKYGRGSFSYIQGSYSEPSKLHKVSHSVTLPNSEIINPVDAAFSRHLFRTTKRGE